MDKGKIFRDLHASTFVMPNPWDVGTTKLLASFGFKALATTSAGFAFSRGLPDGAVTFEAMIHHCREVTAATDLPENFLWGKTDLDDTIKRLQAFEKAGADVLYAPGLSDIDAVRTVCSAVSKPVNVMARPGFTVADLAAAGVKRVSLGPWLTNFAFGMLETAAREIQQDGTFGFTRSAMPFGKLQALFRGGGTEQD
ncbi:MAG: isocitrate lyase/phosphoenolpyruvate mutase family protein [Mesorhizobium sp.]|nr:MAG: isocitrate lyase/phosphoenolpyruvate mutase family protein [Mesorhizobium sp.]